MIPKHILIADDDPDLLRILELSLGMLGGHSILRALSAKEAFDLAVNHIPDLVILDQQLGDALGLDLLKQLKTNDSTRNIGVLLLTGANNSDLDVEVRNAGGLGVLAKPFDPGRIHDDVSRMAGWVS